MRLFAATIFFEQYNTLHPEIILHLSGLPPGLPRKCWCHKPPIFSFSWVQKRVQVPSPASVNEKKTGHNVLSFFR